MKRIFRLFGLSLLFAAASCGPMSYTMDVETRSLSQSGLDLAGKTFGMVYIDSGNPADSLLAASIAEGFASTLEKEYFSGEQLVGLYRVDKKPSEDYASKEVLLDMIMDAGSDVLFLLDAPEIGVPNIGNTSRVLNSKISADSAFVTEVSVPFKIRINVYDSMNPADSVFSFKGSTVTQVIVYSDGHDSNDKIARKSLAAIGDNGLNAGKKSASMFLSTWKKVRIPIIYYDSSKWIEAAYAASEYEWKQALDIWLSFTKSGNLEKRSCAEFNCAVACYMLGQKNLALEWLERSDADYPLHVTREFRKIIGK